MSILGNRVLRKEDGRFLRGEGTYVENLPLEGAVSLTFVRSPFAHAKITSVDTSAAADLPGVEVLTGADVDVAPIAPPPIPLIEPRMLRPARREGRRPLRRRDRRGRDLGRPGDGRRRRRAGDGRLRPAARGRRSGRGTEGRAAALPGRRHERRRQRRARPSRTRRSSTAATWSSRTRSSVRAWPAARSRSVPRRPRSEKTAA